MLMSESYFWDFGCYSKALYNIHTLNDSRLVHFVCDRLSNYDEIRLIYLAKMERTKYNIFEPIDDAITLPNLEFFDRSCHGLLQYTKFVQNSKIFAYTLGSKTFFDPQHFIWQHQGADAFKLDIVRHMIGLELLPFDI